MTMTRDSLMWVVGKVVGAAGLLVTGVIDPARLGLTDKQAHTLMVVAGAIWYVSGQLSTSPLGTKADAQTVKSHIGPGVGVVLACALTLPWLMGCHAPVTVTTPQGRAAYTADQVAVRINELQNAAIAAQQQGQLPTATTRTIVQFCVGADATLAQVPAGWVVSLQTAWATTKANLPAMTNPAVTAALAAVDVVIGGLK